MSNDILQYPRNFTAWVRKAPKVMDGTLLDHTSILAALCHLKSAMFRAMSHGAARHNFPKVLDGISISRYMVNRYGRMRRVLKISGEAESPNEGACLRYMMSRYHQKGACLRYMVGGYRRMRGRVKDIWWAGITK